METNPKGGNLKVIKKDLQVAKQMAVEQLEEIESWDKIQSLCGDALTRLFLIAEGMVEGRASINEKDITEFMQTVIDAFEDRVEEDNDFKFDTIVSYAKVVVATESTESGQWKLQDRYLSEEEREEDEDVDLKPYMEKAKDVSFVDQHVQDSFMQDEEIVLAQLAKLIPQRCETYYERIISHEDDTTDLQILRLAYEEKMNTLLLGEAGAGKTLSLKRLAYDLEVPYKSISLNGACTLEDLIGHFVRGRREGIEEDDKGEKKPIIDWVWVDGWLTKLARYGGIFVAEEINAAPPEILFVLHDLLGDVTRKIDLTQAGGDIIYAHHNFFFAATANPDYDGTQAMNKALEDRFDIILDYAYDINVERNFIKDESLLELATMLRGMYPQEISRPISTRLLKQFVRNRSLLGLDTAKQIFINRFPHTEQIAVKSAFESKIG